MNNMHLKERFYNVTHFKPVDRIPDIEFGYWDETMGVWKKQGLPGDVANLDKFFKFDWFDDIPVNLRLSPWLESKVLEETREYKIIQDGQGVTYKSFKDGSSSIPHYLDFPLKGRKEWEEIFKPRLDPSSKDRYPQNWEEIKAMANDPKRERPIGIHFGSFFGVLRDWAGFENISLLCYDDPELIEEMVNHMADVAFQVLSKILPEIKIDQAYGWEDMAFNHGPIISPDMIRKVLVPGYRKVTDLIRANGCDVIYTDCDGNINEMIEPWLEAGINGVFPCEVAAGSDPVAIRRKYEHKVLIFGGVNKVALIKGRVEIKKELKRIRPYVKEGGWIPHVDHRCPPDVTYKNYLYYLELKRDTLL